MGKSLASHLLFRNLLGGRSQFLSCVANICLYDKHKAPEKFEEMKRKLVLEEALNIRVFPLISDLFFNYFFYWRIIALQNFAVFCQTSTWISHAAATAAKFLQSCPTLCNPIDALLPGSHRWQPTRLPRSWDSPGTRTLEWVAISFSNAWKWKVKVKLLSRVRLLVTPWTAAYQAPPSMGFSKARVLEWGAIAF